MKKNYTIEINRFVAILIIMGHHLYRTGAENYHFAMGWVFVEFFFILTGYFTAKHLCKSKENNTIKYTFTKFKKIIGLTCIAILCEYALEFFMLYYDIGVYDLKIIREFFKDLPFELLLIGSSYTTPKLVPVWYLSALFIVFPLFCLLFQIKNKEVRYTFELLIPLLFYGKHGVWDYWVFPINLVRALSCLLLGTFIYDIGGSIIKKLDEYVSNKFYILMQVICFLIPIMLCWDKNPNMLRFIVLCFMIEILIIVNNKGIVLKNKLFEIFGEITTPIFLFHWVVATFIGNCLGFLSQSHRIIIYYSVSILLGFIIAIIRRKKSLSKKVL